MEQDDTTAARPEPAALARIKALAARAKAGDLSALPALREALRQCPEVWQFAGDLERVVTRAWAQLLGGGDPLAQEAIRLRAEALRAELAGDSPTPLEALLAGQVVATHLE